MVDQLFGSKTRVKLLKLFFSNPNRSFYVREITRTVEEQINSVRRELANLLSLGLITSDDSSHNRLYYEVNQDYEHYAALRSIFSEEAMAEVVDEPEADKKKVSGKKAKATKSKTTKAKTTKSADTAPAETADDTAVELPEAKKWALGGNISGIAYSGVYTRDESAGVDIIIIGDAVASKVESIVSGLEKEKNRELRYAVMDVEEWRYRGQVRDKFWVQIMSAKIQVVLDKDDIFKT